MDFVFTAEGLVKRYRTGRALDGLDMQVEAGAIYGFIGKNGAGKTTLLRLLCGLQRPTAGRLTLYGVRHDARGFARARRRMGAVVETPSIYLDMTAADNLRMQYRVLGLPSYTGLDALLKLVGLDGTGRKTARHFSLGMRQRLGIAVALAGDPDFLVLDEPFNGLDPQGIVGLRELILSLNRARGITVLLSSHLLDELGRIATHYGFIDSGRMLRQMTAAELETACRKCLLVEVSDVQALALALDGLGADYRICAGDRAEIYGELSLPALLQALEGTGCTLRACTERDASLERFYLGLLGGGADA